MRFLHTADWHLGRTMRGKSRAAEFEAVLAEVVEIARLERVDALLVCGDIWDTASPAPESDRLLHEALRELIGLQVQVVLLAGNHDSARKLEALGRLSDLLGVFVQAQVRRPDAGGILTLAKGGEVARVAAIPWVGEGRLIDAAEVLGLEADRQAAYAEGAARVYREMCRGFDPREINLVAGHLFVDGARLAAVDGSERLLHIGQAYGVMPAALPGEAQYIALGHVHQPQEVLAAPAPTFYSGSLLQLDFGEREQQKVVRLVEIEPGRPPLRNEAVAITRGRRLIELRGTLDEVTAAAEDAGDAYVRVRLEVERPTPGLAQRVRDAVPGTVGVQLEYERAPEEEPGTGIGQLSPQELFARYYSSQHGAAPAPELLALFTELLDETAGVTP